MSSSSSAKSSPPMAFNCLWTSAHQHTLCSTMAHNGPDELTGWLSNGQGLCALRFSDHNGLIRHNKSQLNGIHWWARLHCPDDRTHSNGWAADNTEDRHPFITDYFFNMFANPRACEEWWHTTNEERTTITGNCAAAGSVPFESQIVWLSVIDSFPIPIVNGCCLMCGHQTQYHNGTVSWSPHFNGQTTPHCSA